MERAGGEYTLTLRRWDHKVVRQVRASLAAGSWSWSWEKDWVWGQGSLLATIGATEGMQQVVVDHQGSVGLLANRCGQRLAELATNPWGLDLFSTTQNGERHRYTGHLRDVHLGDRSWDDFDQMHARYYNPNIARFLSVDPGRDNDPGAPQSWNLYAYVRNNPVNQADPDGRKVLVKDAAAMAYIQSTLPEEVRHKITLDTKGFIHKTTINKIKSDDPNFKALKELVNAKAVMEVATSTAATYQDRLGKIVAAPFFFDPSTSPPTLFLGIIATPRDGVNLFDSGGVYSLSGKISIQLARLPGLAKLQIQKTTAHELYGHALLYIQGKPFEHPQPGVDAFIREIEERFGP